MPTHFDVLCVGEAKIDAFMTLHDATKNAALNGTDICFRFGAKVGVDRYDLLLGGNAANVAVGLSRLGLKTTLFAETGDDELSLRIHNLLAKEHIDRSNILHSRHEASSMSVIINFQGDRTIFSQHVTRDHHFHFNDISASFVFLTSLGEDWKTPYENALHFAESNKIPIAFNPGAYQLREGKELVRQVIKHTTVLFLNKEEAERLIYGDDLKDTDASADYMKLLASSLCEMGAKTVVLTNGSHGSYVLDTQGKLYHQGLYPAKVVERTGAGDAYTAGFLAHIIHGGDIPTAMKWGAANASSVIGAVGAETGLLRKEEIEEKVS